MNQGLLIVVLLLLVLLLSCKAFNYCVLRELFVNKETVKQMMDDIYDVRENFEPCSDDRKKGMTSSSIAEICDDFVGKAPKRNQNRENFEGYCNDSDPEVMRIRCYDEGKCSGENCPPQVLENFQDLPPCCSPDEIRNGKRVGYDCSAVCEGFVKYSPFKEKFLNVPTAPPLDPSLMRPSGGLVID
jgi:hypothetical protein